MALERNNPLPPNRMYYVDVPPDDQQDFADWLSRHKSTVKVRSTTREPMKTGFFWDSDDYLEKYVFEVKEPVFWEGPGYPSKGAATDPNATTDKKAQQIKNAVYGLYEQEKAYQPIDDPDIEPEDSEAYKAFKKGAWVVGGVLAGVVAVHAVFSSALPKLLLRKT